MKRFSTAVRPRIWRAPLLGSALLLVVAAAGRAADEALVATPFAARSGPRGATMFHRMPAAETGIVVENNYDDPRMWGERSRGFFYGPLGTGVAIGDYDADGRPDLLVVSKVEGHRLFRNLGDWRFADVTAPAGVSSPTDREWEQGATWVDVDNDGRLDLYVCRSGAPNLLYVNLGDGTFAEAAAARGLAVNDDSVMACFGDYDRDGWLDVYLVTNTLDVNQDAGRPDLLFRNRGDGTFTDVTAAAGIGSYPFQGHAAVWWDYDNDGWPDLYVANDFSPPDMIYHNDRDGTFSLHGNSAVPHTTNSSMGADLGDLNNDGWIDLLVADMEPTTHEKEFRTMAEARAKLNHEFLDPFEVIQLPRNALYLNTGTAFCLEAAELAGLARTDWTWSVLCDDLDGDGRVDVHFTNGMNREQNNIDLMQRIAGAESLRQQIQLMKSSPVLAEANLAFRNAGDLRFENVSAAWGLDEVGVSFGAALGDLDGDGDLDLVYTNYQQGVTVLRNDTAEGNRISFDLRGRASNRFGIGATVRLETAGTPQVRQLHLARGYMSSSEPAVHFGLGDLDRVDRVTITWPSGHEQTLTRLAANHRYTITEPAGPAPGRAPAPAARPQWVEVSRFAGLTHTAREANFDESRVQPLLPRTFNRAGPALAVGDLDGDEVDDLCIGGTTEDAPRLLLADRQGGFRESAALVAHAGTGVNDGPVLIYDADGDGKNDVLLTSGGSAAPADSPAYQPRLWLNQGEARFRRAPAGALPALAISVGAATAADFDRDGSLDVFLGGRVRPGAYPQAPHSALLRNRGGVFADVTDIVASALKNAGLVTSALWTDTNGDGWIDLLVATEWGPVRCFRNREGQRFDECTSEAGFDAAGHGWWTSLAAADFNGDGQVDYVAGNLGLNTPYRATSEQPLVLFRGPFGPADTALSIEGYYEGNLLYPRNPRGPIAAVLPFVSKRFPRNNDYAKATLAEIVGADALAQAARSTINQLQSGVFLSHADGRFRFAPLPRIAQIAPLQGIAARDFDGDGRADIVAVQNDYTFSQNVGRFDGGLGQFLKGDGGGNFTLVTALAGGLIVPGEARALAVINLDGDAWPDFVVTRSRSPSLAWQNRGAAGNRTLQVKLRGRAGNPSAIGATISVWLSDGTRQTCEVSAGGGVLSQDTTTLYFGARPDARPSRLQVRWPSGEVSTADLDGTPGRLELVLPGR